MAKKSYAFARGLKTTSTKVPTVQQQQQILKSKFQAMLKGKFNGNCNVTSCQKPHAVWFNHSTRAYYCEACAYEIGSFAKRTGDDMELYGHALLTLHLTDGQEEILPNEPHRQYKDFS